MQSTSFNLKARVIAWLYVALAFAVSFGCVREANDSSDTQAPTISWNRKADQVSTSAATASATSLTNAPLPNFVGLVERYGDAVVNIDVLQQTQRRAARGEKSDRDPLSEFFRHFGLPMPGGGPGGQILRGSGSGFIVTPDGYILTNAHVVADADEVTVGMIDRRELKAKVVGTDARTDVAVLKVDASNLPTVQIGDHQQLKPGEWVLAIGSPFGFQNSATAGIVSATARSVGGESDVPFIQTDVAVNPGNSGGPLFNLNGEVVGINSMILSQTGGYMGLSFAIPIDVAVYVRDQLIKNGRVVRGRIGVGIQDVNAALAQSFGLDRPRGALVSAVEEGGPASKAGLRPGDVILEVNDQPVEHHTDLSGAIAKLKPNSEAELAIWRDGKERNVEVRIGEVKPDAERIAQSGGAVTEEGARLGLAVRPLTDEEKEATESEGALVVVDVTGAAARAGLQPGDIILGLNGQRIESVDQLRAMAKKQKSNSTIALLVARGDAQIFVPLTVG
jgi:serine protease Do